ncbi:hypothetical protein D3C72_1998470 [compost metagenome]
MDVDVAVLDANVGAAAGQQNFILSCNFDGTPGRSDTHAVLGGELDGIALCLYFNLAFGREQLGARGLGEQADALSNTGQQ